MKKISLIVAALVCACLFAAGTASAGQKKSAPQQSKSQVVWTKQSPHPPFPTERTPVAGFSPNLAFPQPATKATLYEGANRLIRWEGWLDVDAFSVSVLNQMQKQLGKGIEVGSFTIAEPSIADAVFQAETNPAYRNFKKNENLEEDAGANFEGTPTLYVWTYRHNYTDTGLYQLYISAQGRMDIGTALIKKSREWDLPHKDIQALRYEFSGDGSDGRDEWVQIPVYAPVEIWRGAVAKVNAKGELEIVGNEAGVRAGLHNPENPNEPDEIVEAFPLCDWEQAPSLCGNPNYNPKDATGAAFVEPLERAISIAENTVQKRAGNVQARVRTFTPFRNR